MKNNKETEKEVAAAINEFLDGIEGIFKPRSEKVTEAGRAFDKIVKGMLGDFFNSPKKFSIPVTFKARGARAMRHPLLPNLDPAISFADFEKKILSDIADCFEIPEALLKTPFPSRGFGPLTRKFLGRAKRPAFFRASKGDKVFDVRRGWGEIVTLLGHLRNGRTLQIRVNFLNGRRCYYRPDGRIDADDVNPSLYWDEVDIKPPAQPATMPAEPERKTVTMYQIRYKTAYDAPCEKSVCHYEGTGDFMKQQPQMHLVCACIVEGSAIEPRISA